MPDYCFFLSYSSDDRKTQNREAENTEKTDDVRVFHDRLAEAMSAYGWREGGFFDKKGIQGGSEWRVELESGLGWSRVLVPLYSPNYFGSKYCGKEFEVFSRRHSENKKNTFPDVTAPDVILPVMWRPSPTVPDVVKAFQIPDLPDAYLEHGLEHMVRFKRNRENFQKFLNKFARRLDEMARSQGRSKRRKVPALQGLNPPFPGGYKPGLKHVRYIFAAGLEEEMRGRRSRCEAYGVYDDRQDWKPCFPDIAQEAGAIAESASKQESRDSEFLKPVADVLPDIEEAVHLNNIVVLVVDPWSLKLPRIRELVERFDDGEYPNSAVIVNWNCKDDETNEQVDTLNQEVSRFFTGRARRQEYYRDRVTSPEEFRQAILDSFNAVRGRLIELGRITQADSSDTHDLPLTKATG